MTAFRGAMRVLGLMSGTSADGVDVALVRISGRPPHLQTRLEHFTTISFPQRVRSAILNLAGGRSVTAREISQLNFLLGEFFAQAALRACRKFGVPMQTIGLIGSHGQTIYHQGCPQGFLGWSIPSTLQVGEPAIVAERTGITTIADFRPADIAAGGQGAPLVPFVDYLLYRHARLGRAALNIGGIANVTAIAPGAEPGDVLAFDTGPGNMLIDALSAHFSAGRNHFDRDASIARRGNLLPGLLASLLRHDYLRQRPPKTAGREQFGLAFCKSVLVWAARHRSRPEDVLHTATVFSAVSISGALQRFVLPRMTIHQIIVSGGGARNPLLMAQLTAALPHIAILPSSDLGIPVDAKEAFAFAVLAYETWHGRPSNLRSATGARHPAILGKIAQSCRRVSKRTSKRAFERAGASTGTRKRRA